MSGTPLDQWLLDWIQDSTDYLKASSEGETPMTDSRPAKRNQYKILVSFPDDWADEPALAGTTQELYFPTEGAAELARTGFRLRGCTA